MSAAAAAAAVVRPIKSVVKGQKMMVSYSRLLHAWGCGGAPEKARRLLGLPQVMTTLAC